MKHCIFKSNCIKSWNTGSSSRPANMSWRHLHRNNFSSSKTSWRRLENILEDKKLLRWRRLEDVSRHVFKTSWRHVFKTFSRRLLEMFYWEYLLLKNLKSVSGKSVSHISKCKMHQYSIIMIFISFWNWSCISIWRIKISDNCFVL